MIKIQNNLTENRTPNEKTNETIWVVKKLGELLEFKNGLNYRASEDREEILIVGVGDFKDKFLIDENQLSTIEVDSISKDYLMKNGDFVFVRSNGNKELIGRVLFAKNVTKRITHSGFTIRARSKSDLIISEYCATYCSSSLVKKQFMTKGGGSNISNLNQQLLSDIDINLPPIPEQEKILHILDTWSKAIELKEKLIEQKKEQKKGLMQKLLNGQLKVSKRYDKWREFKLGEIGKTYNGLTGKTAEDFGEGKPYIPYKTIFADSKIDINKLDYVRIEKDEAQNRAVFGDIFFTTSSETPDEVGMSSVILDDVEEIYLNSFCFGYRLNNFEILIPEFARYLFRSDYFRTKIYRLAQGSTRFNISKNEVMKINVIVPSIEEQRSISNILSNSDDELKLLQTEVDCLREQKKGLMQLLLTGKIRVKV